MPDLLRRLRVLWSQRGREVAVNWQRGLPFGDYIVDRWERAKSLGFPDGVSVYDSAYVYGDVRIGERTWIGPFVILDGTGELRIGANCSISAGVHIYTHDSVRWATSGGQQPLEYAPTRIGDNCYIGPNSVIAKGVTIGCCCIVGAHSVVLEDIPANSKAVGTPCRVIGEVHEKCP
jgi:acetyltransferase-like isoleucine patch superfamily enzyme